MKVPDIVFQALSVAIIIGWIICWIIVLACGGIIAWTFVENAMARDKPCVLLWRQGNSTTQATGTIKRDISGRAVCEVVR